MRVCPERCPTRPAREMNPEKAGTGRAWPALNFPSAPHAPQLRQLWLVEMQSCPRASSRAPRLAQYGPPVSADTGRYHFLVNVLLGGTVMTEKFAPPEVTIRRYPASRDLRRRGCGSRPGNGSPLPQLLSGREMGAPGM